MIQDGSDFVQVHAIHRLQIEAIEHTHYAMQLFLSTDKPLDLYVLHFSIIIEPASNIARQLEMRLNGSEFGVLDDFGIEKIQNAVFDLAYCKKDDEMKHYQYLIDTLI